MLRHTLHSDPSVCYSAYVVLTAFVRVMCFRVRDRTQVATRAVESIVWTCHPEQPESCRGMSCVKYVVVSCRICHMSVSE